MIGDDFAADAKLNKLRLADEAETLPSMLAWYGTKLAEAKHNRDRAVHALELECAQRELNYRRNPPAGIDKITEGIVKALVTADPHVVEYEEALMEAKKELYTLEIAFSTLESKGSMIKVEQALWGSGYYTT